MKKYFTLFIILHLITVINTSCCLIDPMTKAQNLIKTGKFEDGIKILEKEYALQPNSIPIKSVLAKSYSDYGLALCQDENKPPKVKYPKAKEQFAMALELNPYLTEAKDMYEMIEKIQASFTANKLN